MYLLYYFGAGDQVKALHPLAKVLPLSSIAAPYLFLSVVFRSIKDTQFGCHHCTFPEQKVSLLKHHFTLSQFQERVALASDELVLPLQLDFSSVL